MSDLDPAPAHLADLLVRMTELDWPTTEEERLALFAALDLHDAEDAPRSTDAVLDHYSRRFGAGLSEALRGTASTFRGEFLGVSLFAYDEPVEDGELARAGYRGVLDHVSRRLGPPVEEWGTVREPACLWRTGPLMIEMYCFQRLRSGVMVGPSHAVRSDALDAAPEAPDRTDGPE